MSQHLEAARVQMINQQVRAWEVLNGAVLKAMSEVPRERFVPAGYRNLAFSDMSIPLAGGQHMLSPQLEGRILQSLEIAGGEAVLEIGTGSGYLTGCLARLGGQVTSLEIRPELADTARRTLRETVGSGIDVRVEDAFSHQPSTAYNCIAVTGSLPLPDDRFEQWLAPGGRLFVVTGTAPAMTAWLIRRGEDGAITRGSLFETVLDALDSAPRPSAFVF
ncbi:MAG: protein-L-isoaspartate O-methyltransferase [Gammaproteobacteria bacterium]|nr:protein-L-isoaspartate O-methyltransferase [Gammaproteobacteria bacterium]